MLLQPVVHRAGPEAAAAVALALVEAVGRHRVGPGDPLDGAGVEVVEGDAGGEGDDQAALLAEREAGDPLRHLPALDLAGGRRQPLQQLALDVDPVERLLGDVPDRHLAEPVLRVDDAGDGLACTTGPPLPNRT